MDMRILIIAIHLFNDYLIFIFITVQIQDNLCAALYDEEKCKRSEGFLELRNGDQGVLPLITTGLRRNDVEVR